MFIFLLYEIYRVQLHFVLRIITFLRTKMVVKTRSKHQALLSLEENIDNIQDIQDIQVHINGTKRRVTILTPSLAEANVRTYKVYSPVIKPFAALEAEPEPEPEPEPETTNKKKTRKNRDKKKKTKSNKNKYSHQTMIEEAAEVVDAAEALVSLLQYDDDDDNANVSVSADTPPSPPSSTTASNGRSIHTCINPMQPVGNFVYRIGVYNINQTQHYKSAYVLYDQKSRMFHVYTIISNQLPSSDEEESHTSANTTTATPTTFTLPAPKNTIQTKYTSYISDIISNYISTMIIPSNDFDYYIQDDIIGIVVPNNEFREKAFDEESSYYDIEDLMYDNTSTQTTNGYKAFMLIPSRNFWYSPVGGYYAITDANTIAYSDRRYTPDILTSVMMILSQST